jgi:hypothetical protein
LTQEWESELDTDISITDCQQEEVPLTLVDIHSANTSIVPQPPKQSPKVRGRPLKFPKEFRNKIAMIQALGISARATDGVLGVMWSDATPEFAGCAIETAEICLLELSMGLMALRSKKLTESADLFIMLDGSGTLKLSRSLLAIHFGGHYMGQQWSALFGL